MKPNVSIIITVYNSEKYIEECVRSLFAQTLDRIEYIIVNDATPDNSINILKQIVDEYPQRKPFVQIINLEKNGGVSNARRIGTELASGEYVIHADSDDWVDKDMYECLYKKAIETEADIVGCNFRHEFIDIQYDFYQQYSEDIKENIRRLIDGRIFPSLCTSLTRRSLIDENNIKFPVGLNMGEDLFFNLQLYLKANKIVGMDKSLYHYRHTEDSSCIKHSWESVDSDIKIAGMIERFIRDNGMYAKYANEIEYRKLYSKMPLIIYFDRIDNYKKWLNIYSETHRRIMKFKQINIYLRIELWFAAHNMFYVSKVIRHTILFLHNIKIKIGIVAKY